MWRISSRPSSLGSPEEEREEEEGEGEEEEREGVTGRTNQLGAVCNIKRPQQTNHCSHL